MGVKDLLRKVLIGFLNKSTNVSGVTATGLTKAVVDFSYWEHELLYVIAVWVFEENKVDSVKAAEKWLYDRIGMLERSGVTQLHFVLDGAPLPAKGGTDLSRSTKRAFSAQAARAYKQGPHCDPDKYKKLCRSAVGRKQWLEEAIFISFRDVCAHSPLLGKTEICQRLRKLLRQCW